MGVENRAIGMLDTLEKMNVVLTTETKDKIISLMSKYEVYELRQEDETVIISVQNSYPVINQKTSGKTYENSIYVLQPVSTASGVYPGNLYTSGQNYGFVAEAGLSYTLYTSSDPFGITQSILMNYMYAKYYETPTASTVTRRIEYSTRITGLTQPQDIFFRQGSANNPTQGVRYQTTMNTTTVWHPGSESIHLAVTLYFTNGGLYKRSRQSAAIFRG